VEERAEAADAALRSALGVAPPGPGQPHGGAGGPGGGGRAPPAGPLGSSLRGSARASAAPGGGPAGAPAAVRLPTAVGALGAAGLAGPEEAEGLAAHAAGLSPALPLGVLRELLGSGAAVRVLPGPLRRALAATCLFRPGGPPGGGGGGAGWYDLGGALAWARALAAGGGGEGPLGGAGAGAARPSMA
jgi:hypothetical protein